MTLSNPLDFFAVTPVAHAVESLEKKHAIKSASGSFRWAICHASVQRERGRPDKSSDAAKWGTVAHDLGEKCLKAGDDVLLSTAQGKYAYVDEKGLVTYLFADSGDGILIDDEMLDCVQRYVDFVQQLMLGGKLLVEERLSIEHITGEEGAKGTSDTVLIFPDEIVIVDLKGGMVKVDASMPLEGDLFKFAPKDIQLQALFEPVVFPNTQLVIYSEAARKQYAHLGNFKRVRLIICQPRLNHISECVLDIETHQLWVQWLREQSDACEQPMPRVVPGEKQCQYCKAFPCAEAEQLALSHAIGDFASLDQVETFVKPASKELGDRKKIIPIIRQYCDYIEGRVYAELAQGRPVDGWKMIDGELSDRKWGDENAVRAQLQSYGLKPDEIVNTKLKSPAQVEALVQGKRLNPAKRLTQEQWQEMQSLLAERVRGNGRVVPANDPRPAKINNPSGDFADLTQADNSAFF